MPIKKTKTRRNASSGRPGEHPGRGRGAAKTGSANVIVLGDGTEFPIIYKDRAIIGIDKLPGWMLAPDSWDRTGRNLQLALNSSIQAGDFWARSQQIRFLRFIHRLDADTSGVILFARHPGAVEAYSRLFRERTIEKHYLAIVEGVPSHEHWTCEAPLIADAGLPKRMRVATRRDRPKAGAEPGPDDPRVMEARTDFELLATAGGLSLLLARPATGRTHQIRVHLASAKMIVVGDALYGSRNVGSARPYPLALRAIQLAFQDPFTRRPVRIRAGVDPFLSAFGFALDFDWQSMKMRSRADRTQNGASG